MRSMMAGCLLAACLIGCGGARGEDWADDTSEYTRGYEASKRICRAMKAVEPPKAEAAAGPNCDAEALYYGIGRKADPGAARICAEREAARSGEDDGSPFAGRSLLMTIHANGLGAPRNLDLAIALACRIGGAPAEIDGRVLHLDKLRAEHWTGTDFSVCDDVTSGMLQGQCAAHEARIASGKRDEVIARLSAGWSPERKAALSRLRKTLATFAEAVSDNEVGTGGSASAAFQIEAQERQQAEFVGLLEAVAAGRPPASPPFRQADAALNAVYTKLMKRTDSKDSGAVGKDGIRKTQRTWLAYRDAFAAFGRDGFPGTDADAIRAALTEARTAWLREIGD